MQLYIVYATLVNGTTAFPTYAFKHVQKARTKAASIGANNAKYCAMVMSVNIDFYPNNEVVLASVIQGENTYPIKAFNNKIDASKYRREQAASQLTINIDRLSVT